MFLTQCVVTVNTSCQDPPPLLSLQQRQGCSGGQTIYSRRNHLYKKHNLSEKEMKRNRNNYELKEPWVAGAKQDVSQQINGWKLTADKDRDGGEGKLTASYTQIGAMLHE